MSTVFSDAPFTEWTVADVQARLGGVPLERIQTYPAPGTATEEDVLDAHDHHDRLCELVDGILVEKTGYRCDLPMSEFSDLPYTEWTAADVQARVGGVPPERIRTYPAPGTATEQDVLDLDDHHDRLCELVDGILVEKPMSTFESMLATRVTYYFWSYLEAHDLGIATGADGMLKILRNRVRIPDACFISWERMPGRQLPKRRVYALAPDLAVEVLSASNTRDEMKQKLHDYFAAGTRLVWYIDPKQRTARAYTAEDQWEEVGRTGSLSGRDVLPGFALPLDKLFGWAERHSGQ